MKYKKCLSIMKEDIPVKAMPIRIFLRPFKRKTNFDITLEEQFKDKDLTDPFKKAGRTWDAAL